MLEKFLNKKVKVFVTTYGSATPFRDNQSCSGTVTNIDSNYIEINNNKVIQIKYIVSIECI